MTCKYILNGKLNIRDFRHDIASLIEPLSMAIDLAQSEKSDKAIFLQQEVLKSIKNIVEELKGQAVDTEITNS